VYIGIATDYRLDGLGSIPGKGKKLFCTTQAPHRLWGPPSVLFSGFRGAVSLRVTQQGREIDHSPQSSAEVKNGGVIYVHSPTLLHDVVHLATEV
jgi:hypothetical protein